MKNNAYGVAISQSKFLMIFTITGATKNARTFVYQNPINQVTTSRGMVKIANGSVINLYREIQILYGTLKAAFITIEKVSNTVRDRQVHIELKYNPFHKVDTILRL